MNKFITILFFVAVCKIFAIVIPGSTYHIPLVVNHNEISGESNHFLYQIDLSDVLSSDSIFKKKIKNSSNIFVYDSTERIKCSKFVHIDTANNYLIISWDASTTTSYDKMFYVCTENEANEYNDETSFTNNMYTYEWPIKEYSNGVTTYEVIENGNLTVNSPASIGNEGVFGRCGSNTGLGSNYLSMDSSFVVLPEDVSGSIEFLIFINGYGQSGLGRIITAWPFVLYVWSGSGEQLRVTNDGFSNIANFPISFGNWHHVLLVREYRGYLWVYIDGIRSSTGMSGPCENNQNYYVLGEPGDYAFNGSISDLGITYDETSSTNYPLTRTNELLSPESFWTIGTGVVTKKHDLMPMF